MAALVMAVLLAMVLANAALFATRPTSSSEHGRPYTPGEDPCDGIIPYTQPVPGRHPLLPACDIEKEGQMYGLGGGPLPSHWGEAEAVVVEALDDEHAWTRTWAVWVLGRWGASASRSAGHVIDSLSDPSPVVRSEACAALRELEPDLAVAVPALGARLADESAYVRIDAARALLELGAVRGEALQVLREGLDDADPGVSEYAREQVGALGHAAGALAPFLVTKIPRGAGERFGGYVGTLASVVGPQDAAIVPELVDLLDDCTDECYGLVESLGRIGPTAAPAVPSLERFAASVDAGSAARKEAVVALLRIGGAGSVDLLEEVDSLDPAARSALGWRLYESGADLDLGLALLLEALEDGDRQARRDAAWELNHVDEWQASALPILIRGLDDPATRGEVGRIFSDMGPTAAPVIGDLVAALAVPDSRVWILRALGNVGPAASEAVPALLPFLRTGRDQERSAAAMALGAVGSNSTEVVDGLLGALREDRNYSSSTVRAEAARALGRLRPAGSAEVARALEKAASDPHVDVRQNALWALRRLESGGDASEEVSP